MANFVLVHGAWHGGWCWQKVRTFLEERGHRVWTPDLPGHGDDPGDVADATLDNYVDRVVAPLDECDAPAVLVGHSSGGGVIAQ
ncbi:MAG: alpha/beta fold hydrolase, partial [Pseudomonadales bacterium]|nr:alpha/beta fold hydrolase [Pseudomonadales bacterium]